MTSVPASRADTVLAPTHCPQKERESDRACQTSGQTAGHHFPEREREGERVLQSLRYPSLSAPPAPPPGGCVALRLLPPSPRTSGLRAAPARHCHPSRAPGRGRPRPPGPPARGGAAAPARSRSRSPRARAPCWTSGPAPCPPGLPASSPPTVRGRPGRAVHGRSPALAPGIPPRILCTSLWERPPTGAGPGRWRAR